ncbi:MAG: 50S ribosomal protein L24 [SAR202 cluster bacterium Io17-Chloro-G3]|nr:MAG: 50S ribosomal protein L24 [SAR202 cluster bacterium Io17-Chloro-G3]
MALNIHQDDTVQVISGKDRGRRGKVQRILSKESRVTVEGLNMVKRHQRATNTVRQAGIISQEAPLHISNIKLVCTQCSKAVRVGFQFLEDGRKVRICRSCKQMIDI